MHILTNLTRMSIFIKFQERATLITSFAMPILLMVVLGLAIQDGDTTLIVDVYDQDNTESSQALLEQLRETAEVGDAVIICVYGQQNSDACGLDDIQSADDIEALIQERLEDQVAAGVLELPAGLEANMQAGALSTLPYRANDGLNAATVTRTTVQTVVDQYRGSMIIAEVGLETAQDTFDAFDGGQDEDAARSAYNSILSEAQTALQDPPATVQSTASQFVDRLGTNQSVPGIASMFVMINLLNTAAVLIYERERGTLQRLYVLPTRRVNIVGGKVTAEFVFGLGQFLLFVAIGVFMGVNWGNDPLGVLAIITAFSFACTCLGFALATIVRSSEQASGIALMMSLTLAPLGGAWWPAEIMPDFMQTIGHISPIAWAMDSFVELQFNNGTLIDILPNIGALIVMSVIFLGFGVFNFKYE